MQGFMIALLTGSLAMSLLALLYMAVSPMLSKRYSEKGRYYAWLILVIGLIVPFRPQLGTGIVKVTPTGTAAPAVQAGSGAPIVMPAEGAALPTAASISWWQIAAALWMAGLIVSLAYHGVKQCRFLKMARRWSEGVSDPETIAIMDNLKGELGIARQIDLYRCEIVGSPMLVGFAKLRILLPGHTFSPQALRFVLKHELVHYRRRDLWYRGLTLLAVAMHWFNPVVYLMAKAIDALCETSCDAEVVRGCDLAARGEYSKAMLGVARYQSGRKTTLSTNFYGGKKGMKKRTQIASAS